MCCYQHFQNYHVQNILADNIIVYSKKTTSLIVLFRRDGYSCDVLYDFTIVPVVISFLKKLLKFDIVAFHGILHNGLVKFLITGNIVLEIFYLRRNSHFILCNYFSLDCKTSQKYCKLEILFAQELWMIIQCSNMHNL